MRNRRETHKVDVEFSKLEIVCKNSDADLVAMVFDSELHKSRGWDYSKEDQSVGLVMLLKSC